jgi:import receptor subunit TOM70
MSQEVPVPPLGQPVKLDDSSFASSSSASSSSLWDRISTWASENKAAVYTIAGVTLLVTAAGIYYVNTSQTAEKEKATTPKKKARKRKAKKSDVESSAATEKSETQTEKASVTSGDLPVDLDELTEEVISSLSEQVSLFFRSN